MIITYAQMTVEQIRNLVVERLLNPDPIGQRPAVISSFKKSQEIIRSLLGGMGVGMLTLRNIKGNAAAKSVYKDADWLAIDGGHRIRAIIGFMSGDFGVDGLFFASMSDEDKETFRKQIVCIADVVCTPREATDMFRAINTTTPVNFMEMIMSDDESKITEVIRRRSSYVKEYGNVPSLLFGVTSTAVKEKVSDCFDMQPNHRRKWDEYIAIAMIKASEGGFADAGQPAIESLVHYDTLPDMKIVDRFLKDAYLFKGSRGKKFNTDTFAAFLVVWFGIYDYNKTFVIDNIDTFMKVFMNAYTLLTGRDKTLENVTIEYDNEPHFLKEFFRKNMKNFADGEKQKRCFEEFMKVADVSYEDLGVTIRTETRSISSSEREERLALQGYKCAIDGKPLELKDAVYGHDTAWAKGGDLESGAIIRAVHNRDMGTTTLDEYRMILNFRNEKSETKESELTKLPGDEYVETVISLRGVK